jgi:hypothetical protein
VGVTQQILTRTLVLCILSHRAEKKSVNSKSCLDMPVPQHSISRCPEFAVPFLGVQTASWEPLDSTGNVLSYDILENVAKYVDLDKYVLKYMQVTNRIEFNDITLADALYTGQKF